LLLRFKQELPDRLSPPAASHGTGLPQSLRLYVFDCGTTHIPNTERFGFKREEVATADLSDPCFLVAHPKGTLIWDTGAVPDAAWNPVGHPVVQHVVLADSQERDVTVVNSLRAPLAELGYAPSDITYLALSHYHYDHTANANEFAASTWLVREVERDAMFAEKPPGTTQPSTYSALRQSKTVILKADEHDVFGDGAVIIKSAPGHTPAHRYCRRGLSPLGGRGMRHLSSPSMLAIHSLFVCPIPTLHVYSRLSVHMPQTPVPYSASSMTWCGARSTVVQSWLHL